VSCSSELCHHHVFKQLQEKQKAARHTRACDYRHLLLLLPFTLSNLFRDEVEEHNSHHQGNPVVDPSEELIGVANVFLRWYKLFRQTTPGKTGAEINILRSLSDRHVFILFSLYQLYLLLAFYQLLALYYCLLLVLYF